MPERAEGPFSDPPRGDGQQSFGDALARIEMLERAVAELASQLADEARAEEIMRRAAAPAPPVSPRRRTRSPGRRGDTFLKVVRVALVAVLGLAAVVALMAPRHLREQRYSPRCAVSCPRLVAHQNRAGDRR